MDKDYAELWKEYREDQEGGYPFLDVEILETALVEEVDPDRAPTFEELRDTVNRYLPDVFPHHDWLDNLG